MWTETELAYLAGIIDGEGTFHIGFSSNRWTSRVYVVNTDQNLIKWIQNKFGGLIYSRDSLKNPTWKTKHEWLLEKTKILPMVELILPYLICKKAQAELMIKFRKTFQNFRDRSEETFTFRSECHKHMKSLNHRGPP